MTDTATIQEILADSSEVSALVNSVLSLLDKRIKYIVDQRISRAIENALDTYDPSESYNFGDAVRGYIDDHDFSDDIERAVDDHDFSDALESAVENKVEDIAEKTIELLRDNSDVTDDIAKKSIEIIRDRLR